MRLIVILPLVFVRTVWMMVTSLIERRASDYRDKLVIKTRADGEQFAKYLAGASLEFRAAVWAHALHYRNQMLTDRLLVPFAKSLMNPMPTADADRVAWISDLEKMYDDAIKHLKAEQQTLLKRGLGAEQAEDKGIDTMAWAFSYRLWSVTLAAGFGPLHLNAANQIWKLVIESEYDVSDVLLTESFRQLHINPITRKFDSEKAMAANLSIIAWASKGPTMPRQWNQAV